MKTLMQLARDSVLAMVFHVAPRFANVLVFILIGRLAGPAQAGVFSLATTYLLIITTCMRGLDDLLIRQVARETHRAANYLANFLALRFVLSIGLYAGLIFVIQRVLNYSASTTIPIVILTLSVIPDSLAFVGQSVLLGERRFGAPAVVLGVVNLFKLMAGALILVNGGGLIDIAWIWLLGSCLAMAAMLMIAFRQVGGLHAGDWFDYSPLKTHWHAVLSFTAITTLAALDSQTDTVLLSVFRSDAEIGWYNAATTITATLVMLVQAYRFAAYPLMTRYAQNAPEKLVVFFQKSVHYMGVISMPLVLGLGILAPQIVGLIFGPKFAPTVLILQVLLPSLLFFFIGEPFNRLMLVRDRQRRMMIQFAISASANVLINLLLIPRFGAIGAAFTRTCSVGLYFALNYDYTSRNLIRSLKLKSLIRPALATLVLGAGLFLTAQNYLVVSILGGAVLYVLALWLVGGVLKDEKVLIRQAISVRTNRGRSDI